MRDLVPREEKRDLGTSFPFATSARSPISVQNNLKKGEIEHQKAKKKNILTFPIQNNRPFPSSKKSHLQSEAKCEAIDMKMIFDYDANKTHFHNKGFALSLVLRERVFGTRK